MMKKIMFFFILFVLAGTFFICLNKKAPQKQVIKVKNHAADLPKGMIKNSSDQDTYIDLN